MIPKVAEYEVIVVGSGGGGLRAAIGSAAAGAKTLVLSRGKASRSGATLLAGANISADIACDGGSLAELGITDANRGDTKEKFYSDILHEGFFLNNPKLVELFVEEAPNRIRELMDWGIKVLGTEGDRGIAVFGSAILDVLFGKARSLGVEFREDRVFTDLVVEEGMVRGVVCLDLLSGKLEYYAGKAVVLATGGSHNLFRHNSGSTDLCGEGPAAALRVGASLLDMEMISFCPTVMESPCMYKGNILPYIFHSLGFGALKNKFGKTFTAKHLPRAVEELALNSEWNKMLLSYAIQKEINDGGGSMHGGVYFCLDRYPTNLFDELYHDLPSLKTGIYKDIMQVFERGEAVRVSPGAHYFEGGIRIDRDMGTGVPGLFAAGECTGGMFGANRVSAATTEMLVEGAIAGESAAFFAKNCGAISRVSDCLSEIEHDLLLPFSVSGGEEAQPLKESLQEAASESLMVLRSQEKLDRAFVKAKEIRSRLKEIEVRDKTREYNREWLDYLELRNMSIVAGAILKSAGLRKESRGVHVREDHFVTDNRKFLKNIVIVDTDFNFRWEPVPTCRVRPSKEVVDYIEGIELVTAQLS
jgi:succinate dehydrogenase/fumarate reductase flavoprotein subunit